jgi:hypothetical protein
MERHFADIAHHGQQQREEPGVEGRVRKAAQVHAIAQEDVLHVVGVQRIDLSVLGLRPGSKRRRPESPD